MQTAEELPTQQPDVAGEVDVNPSLATERLDGWLDSLVAALPSLAIAAALLLAAWLIGKLANRIVRKRLAARDRDDLGQLLGGMLKWGLALMAFAFGLTMIFPSLKPGDLFAGLGVSSVAVGFAFKDILQNWLAGLLLLLRRPFEPGDQIEVGKYEGTVQTVEARSTMIRTYDGQRVVIPNSDVYGSPVLVKTEADLRRSQLDIEVGFKESIAEMRGLLTPVMEAVPGVRMDPKTETLAWDIGRTSITLRLRWWTKAPRAQVVQTRAQVVEAVHRALEEAGVSRPLDVEVRLEGKDEDSPI